MGSMADELSGLQTTSLRIPPDERRRLEEMAATLGYMQPRGPGAHRIGNISALVRAIARGEYTLVHSSNSDDRGDNRPINGKTL